MVALTGRCACWQHEESTLEHLATAGILWWKVQSRRNEMEILNARCAGWDMQKKHVKACIASPARGRETPERDANGPDDDARSVGDA